MTGFWLGFFMNIEVISFPRSTSANVRYWCQSAIDLSSAQLQP